MKANYKFPRSVLYYHVIYFSKNCVTNSFFVCGTAQMIQDTAYISFICSGQIDMTFIEKESDWDKK